MADAQAHSGPPRTNHLIGQGRENLIGLWCNVWGCSSCQRAAYLGSGTAHFLLQDGAGEPQDLLGTVHACMHAQSFSCVQLFCDPTDCSPPGSSVHGILPAKILEWVAMPSSRASSPAKDQIHVSCIVRRVLNHCTVWKAILGNGKANKVIIYCPHSSSLDSPFLFLPTPLHCSPSLINVAMKLPFIVLILFR